MIAIEPALPIYLDHAATTPLAPGVLEAMLPYLTTHFGNPASLHGQGRQAATAVMQARAQVAALLNADPREIIWTSGATEANNLAIKGAAQFYQAKGRHLITARTEHRSVLDACSALARQGYELTLLEPGDDGRIGPAQLTAAIRADTILVSLMHINNETGIVQDIAALGEVCRRHGAKFHVDAVQGAGKLALDLARLPVDYLSLSAHKLYGPKGIGALYVRREPRARLEPLLHGGGHERGLRSGTLPVALIVGFGVAAELASQGLDQEPVRLAELRERLWRQLSTLGGVLRNGAAEATYPGILNVSFEGVNGESLFAGIGGRLSLATGSACSAAEQEPSYVLRALGRSEVLAQASLRLSLGRFTDMEQIEAAARIIIEEVRRLRQLDRGDTRLEPSCAQPWHEDYSPQVWAHFHRPGLVDAPVAEAGWWIGEAGARSNGRHIRLALRRDERELEARFSALGCPASIACGSWLCRRLRGLDPRQAGMIDAEQLAQALQLTPVQRAAAVLVEDALRAALAQETFA
jgi:cysteine desulfurase